MYRGKRGKEDLRVAVESKNIPKSEIVEQRKPKIGIIFSLYVEYLIQMNTNTRFVQHSNVTEPHTK